MAIATLGIRHPSMRHHPPHCLQPHLLGTAPILRPISSGAPVDRVRCVRRAWLITMMVVVATAASGCGRSRPVDPQELRRGDKIEVSVVGVHDGDTLTGLTADHLQVKVRLDGIDAPELGQPFGKAAKRALSEKAFGHGAKVIVTSHDQYGRLVGHVTVNDHDVGKDLVREGFAWCDPRFNHDKSLIAIEQGARRSRVGLWADKAPTPPWEYRKHRERKSEPTEPVASAGGWSWFRWW